MTVDSPTSTDLLCVRCGHPLPEGSYWCPACGKLNASRNARLIFALILLGIIAGTVFTRWYVSYLHDLETSLGQRWFGRGEQAMTLKYNTVAIEDYRNALGYEPDNRQYRLRLAEALLAEGHLNEARSHLLSLWSEEPADAEVNLDLARVYAKQNLPANAIRYYRTAIDGVWDDNPLQQRIAARMELVNYLLQRNRRAAVVAELIALQAEGVQDPPVQMTLGKLLLQVGEPQRAEQAFNAVVKDQPDNGEAWSGAGQAALALGDYHKAERLLTTAVNLTSAQPGSEEAERLALSRELLEVDPSLRALSIRDRAARVASAYELAMKRLTECAAKQGVELSAPVAAAKNTSALANVSPAKQVAAVAGAPSSLQLLYNDGVQRKSSATATALHNDPDDLTPTMEFVYQVIRATEAACPPQSVEERALQVLAHHDSEDRQ